MVIASVTGVPVWACLFYLAVFFFFFQAEDGIRDDLVTGVQTCALPISDLFVDAFVIDEEQRQQTGVARAPREQLLVRQSGDDLDLALFVDPATVANLERHDPSDGLHDGNFHDFCLAVEGVSHSVYIPPSPAPHPQASALDLQLQPQVD